MTHNNFTLNYSYNPVPAGFILQHTHMHNLAGSSESNVQKHFKSFELHDDFTIYNNIIFCINQTNQDLKCLKIVVR